MSGLVVAFLLLDGGIKLVPIEAVITTSRDLGIPVHLARTLGILTLVCALLYAIPATSVLGAVLMTGYLGGAVYVHLRAGSPIVLASAVRRLSRRSDVGRPVAARTEIARPVSVAPLNLVCRPN